MPGRTDPPASESPKPAPGSGESLRRSLAYFGTVVAGQGISLLLLPFVTRALAPEVYGAYSLALAVSGLVGMVASSWIRNVALRLYFDAAGRGASRGFYLGTVVVQALFFSVLYAAVVAAMAWLDVELASLSVMVRAGVMMLFGDLAVHSLTLLRAEKRTGAYAVGEIGAGVLRFVVTLGGLAVGVRSAELLLDATAVGYALAAAIAVPILWRRMEGPSRIDLAGTLEVVRHGPGALPFSVAGWVERLADRLVIEYVMGTAAVGVYSVAYTLGERTMGTLVKAVFMMAWPNILASWKEGGTASARGAVRQALALYGWFTCGPALFLIVYGGDLLRWFTGAAYHQATDVVAVVAASMWLGGVASYLNRHLELGKRFGTLSGVTMFGSAVNVALNLWLVPRFGMLGAAWATLANRLLNAAVFFVMRDRDLVSIPVRHVAAAIGGSLVNDYGTRIATVLLALAVPMLGRMALRAARFAGHPEPAPVAAVPDPGQPAPAAEPDN